MRMSVLGAHTLEQREGIRLSAYPDPGTGGEPWTIGVGHTGTVDGARVKRGMTITHEKCDELFMEDIATYEDTVNDLVKVPLTQNRFDALVSFTFNIGKAGFARSSALVALNKGDYTGCAEAMMLWVKPAILKGRRTSEVKQFLTKDTLTIVKVPEVVQKPVVVVTPPTPAVKLTLWQRIKEWIF